MSLQSTCRPRFPVPTVLICLVLTITACISSGCGCKTEEITTPPPDWKNKLQKAGWKVSLLAEQLEVAHPDADGKALATLNEALTTDKDTPNFNEVLVEIKSGEELGNEDIKKLVERPNMRRLTLENVPKVTSAAFEDLSNWKILTSLTVSGSAVDDSVFESLETLPKLKALRLTDSKSITGTGLPRLVKITTLTDLSLEGTGLTDENLKKFTEHPSLVSLNVRATDLTQEGIEHAKNLPEDKFPELQELEVAP